MSMVTSGLFLCLLSQLSEAAQLRSGSHDQADTVISVGPPAKAQRHPPSADLLEDGFSYASPPGSGCKEQPEWAKNASDDDLTEPFNVDGWSGYCQIGWSACPDALLNKDYMYYAKALGPAHIKKNHILDKQYCTLNGWLEPEVRDIVGNFTALQAKGKEHCQKPNIQKHIHKMKLGHSVPVDIIAEASKNQLLKTLKGSMISMVNPFKVFNIVNQIKSVVATIKSIKHTINSAKQERIGEVLDETVSNNPMVGKVKGLATTVNTIKNATKSKEAAQDLLNDMLESEEGLLADFAMDQNVADTIAAEYCALGDVSCEMAYCNYAFCKLPDGSIGTMSECDGWNQGKGMSAR